MNFINNYAQQVQLALGAESLELDLFNGTYRLTLSDARGQAATRWEYVEAVMDGGTATLTRGLEDTDDQDWPEGTWIYCSVTAGVLNEFTARIVNLEAQVLAMDDALVDLFARVEALEAASP